MTTARSQLVDPSSPGYYHCISRCVRRAWLCGFDALTGQSFEHRQPDIANREIHNLASFLRPDAVISYLAVAASLAGWRHDHCPQPAC